MGSSALAIVLLVGAAWAGWLGQAAGGNGGAATPDLDEAQLSILRDEHMNEGFMQRAYSKIDAALGPYSDITSSRAQVKRLLANELRKPRKSIGLRAFGKPKRNPMSRLNETLDKSVALNALIRLWDLFNVVSDHFDCTYTNTRRIKLNDRLANEPMRKMSGQPNGSESVDNSHIGKLVLAIAAIRADHCLPLYRDKLERLIARPGDSVQRLWTLLDELLRKRFQAAGLLQQQQHPTTTGNTTASDQLDEVFETRAAEARATVERLKNGLELDELKLVLARFDASTQTGAAGHESFRYERVVRAPCSKYLDLVERVFYPMEFDLKSRDRVSARAKYHIGLNEADKLIGRHRAYYLMCEKLEKEKSRFASMVEAIGLGH